MAVSFKKIENHFSNLYDNADRTLIILGILLVLISFAAAFSTSSNLINHYMKHTAGYYLTKHFILVVAGLVVFMAATVIPVNWYKKFAYYMMAGSTLLVLYTDFFGGTAGVENVRRWLRFGPVSIQPSMIALTVSLMFTAYYLDKHKQVKTSFSYDVQRYWMWLGAIAFAVVIYNNSTALLILMLNGILLFIGGYSFKKFLYALLMGLMMGLMYFLAAKAFPQYIPNRIDTLMKRVERFTGKGDETDIQSLRAKIAIASGGLFRFAPGKSVQKNLLSQSSSDFIYAVIVEEYGAVLGGLLVLLLYILLSVKILAISRLTNLDYYRRLLVLALGLPITFQALINMSVAVGLIPVTGQPLPVISSGGTTLFMTAFSLGVIAYIGAQAKWEQNNMENNE